MLVVAGAAAPVAARGHDEIEVVVATDSIEPGAARRDREDVETTPARVPEDLLRALPGLYLSAHGGRGKSFQMFYRGFDAQHGADLAVSVEGVPLNEPSNVHAHGYVDLGIVPTALVRELVLRPGSDAADVGGFGTAASIDLSLGREALGAALRVAGGTDRSGAVTLAWRPRRAGPETFVVGEADLGLGVAEGRSWRQARVAVGAGTRPGGHAQGRVLLLASHGDFDSPGAVRADDVAAGRVGFYDAYPGAGGGRSDRLLAIGKLGVDHGRWRVDGTVWAGARALDLRQDFTGSTVDPVRGDATRQQHASRAVGLRVVSEGRWQVAGHPWRLVGGVEGLSDGMHQRLERVDTAGAPWGELRVGRIEQITVAGWMEGELGWKGRLRLVPALRFVAFHQAVAGTDDPDVPWEATRWAGTVAPRVRLEARPHDRVEVFAAYGRGYRPPRAEGGVLGALVTSDAVHGGLRVDGPARVGWTLAGFWTRLDDEQVFDHPSGVFVGAGATRRAGAELTVEVEPIRHLRLDSTVTFADARFIGTGEPVPYAPPWLGRIGLGAHELPLGRASISAGLRALFLGPRPLPQGFVSQGAVSVDALLGVSVGPVSVGVQLDNLLGLPWRDGEFVYASWWDTTRPQSLLPTVHLTAGTPTAGRLWVEGRW